MKADWTLDGVIRHVEKVMLSGYKEVIPGGIYSRPRLISTPLGVIHPTHEMIYPNGWRVYWGERDGVAAYILVPPEVR